MDTWKLIALLLAGFLAYNYWKKPKTKVVSSSSTTTKSLDQQVAEMLIKEGF